MGRQSSQPRRGRADGTADADVIAQAVLQGLDEGVLVTDAHGRVTFMNPEAERLTGAGLEESASKRFEDVYRAFITTAVGSREAAPNPLGEALSSERSSSSGERVLLVGSDGTERVVKHRAVVLRSTKGAVTGAVLLFRELRPDEGGDEARRVAAVEASRLRAMFDHGLLAALVAVDGTLIEVNRAFLKLAGRTSVEVLGRFIWDVAPWDRSEEDARFCQQAFEQALAGEEVHGELPYVLVDGTEAALDFTLIPVRDEGGTVRYVMQKGFDVTERKREETRLAAAQAARETDTRFRRIADVAPVMIWVADPTGSCSFLSRSWYEFTGQTPATGIGYGWIEAIHRDDRHLIEKAFMQATQREESFRIEYRLRRHDGSYRWAIDSAAPHRDENGEFLGFLGSVIDVTERVEAERVVRANEERFRTLANSIPQLAWMARPDGHIFWYNQRWYDYTGTTFSEVEGWGWSKVHDAVELPRVVKKIKRHFASGEPWEDTFPIRRHDGEMRWHLSRMLPIRDEDGRVMLWFGTNTDITDQREMEQALRETDRRKDEFLATLAHELRNPLAPIRNALEVIRLAPEDHMSTESAHAVIERQLHQLVRLVDDLLDLSRISRGIIQLHEERVDLATIVRSAVETSLPLIEELEHDLTLSWPDEPLFVNGDVTRLAQVFSNLLNNAAKYTPPGGKIDLKVERRGEKAVVVVTDNGVGIPTHMLKKIFDMFTQVDMSLERSYGGLGIGLTLVQRLVEMHGGSVVAESGFPSGGSRFTVALPATRSAAQREPVAPGSSTGGTATGRRILVVDDNVDSTLSMAMMLRLFGNSTATAHDGLEALEVAERFRPEVVLLDLGMPRLNGYEAAKRLRAEPWGKDVLLIALTGWGQEHERRKTMEAGFDHHLVKPVDVDTLKRILAS